MSTSTALPFVDEHVVDIDATSDKVWQAVTDTLRSASGRLATIYARAVRCDDTAARDWPATGSSIAGFHVVTSVPGQLLALEGRHHFSTYALTFRIERADGERSRLSAQTHAAFPGPAGRAYRSLVIGTRGHKIAMRRMLASIGKRAEQR